jgi:hypothetical protein
MEGKMLKKIQASFNYASRSLTAQHVRIAGLIVGGYLPWAGMVGPDIAWTPYGPPLYAISLSPFFIFNDTVAERLISDACLNRIETAAKRTLSGVTSTCRGIANNFAPH